MIALIPEFGKLFYGDLIRKQVSFDIEPDYHMQAIGYLVRFNAYSGWFDLIDSADELIQLNIG